MGSETTQSKMARRLNHLLLLLPAVILADGPGGHHHGAHHGDHHGAHGAHHGAHNADHGHGAAAHHGDHGAAGHHPVQHTVVSSSPVRTTLSTAAEPFNRGLSAPVSAFSQRLIRSSTAFHKDRRTWLNLLPLIPS